MVGYIVLALSLGLPLALGLALRVSAPHLFFSVMAAELLARYFGHNAEVMLQAVFGAKVADYGEVLVLSLPLLATAVFLRNTLTKSRVVLHVLPWMVTGVVLTAFALPLLPEVLQAQIRSIKYGGQLADINSLVIGGVVIMQLVALWLLNRRKGRARTGIE